MDRVAGMGRVGRGCGGWVVWEKGGRGGWMGVKVEGDRGGQGGRGGRVGRGGEGWRGGLVERGVWGGGLIHNSVQTAGVCPSLPCPCLTKCRLAASAACTWVRQGAGEGGALVSTQPSPLIRNWSGGCVKILQSFALSNVGSKSL